MENRIVALSVLEDLIHWPLAPRDGSTAPNYSTFYLTGKCSDPAVDEDDDDELCFVAANAVGDQHLEPRARRQARYRAVLRLPMLCHKLGARWVTSEVVPYLLRCLEEEDPQLSFVVGVALLGLVLPQPLHTAPNANPKKADKEAAAASTAAGSPNSSPSPAAPVLAYHSYLSLEAVQPVVEALAAARDPCTRHFAAQVVIPHLLFGMSLERDVSHGVGGWEGKYIPQWVLAEIVAQRGADGDSGAEAGDAAGALSAAAAEDDDGGYFDRLVAAAYQQQRRMLKKPGAADGKDAKSEAANVSALEGSKSKPPTARPPDPLQLRESCGLLFDEEFTSLCLSQRRDPLLAHCGLREAGAASAAASAITERRTKQLFLSRVRSCGGLTLLRGVPMALYGAAYASERGGAAAGGPPDYFFLNVQAHTLVEDIAGWLEALAPSPAPAPASSSNSSNGGRQVAVVAKQDKPFVATSRKHVIRLADYLCEDAPQLASSPANGAGAAGDDGSAGKGNGAAPPVYLSRREALRLRWRAGLTMLQGMLESQQPGTVAAAVEAIAMLRSAVNSVLTGADVAAIALSTTEAVVAKPCAPLRTEAELQALQYYATRRHVAYCLVAATGPRRTPGSPSEAARMVQTTLTAVQDTLLELLARASVLVPMTVVASEEEQPKVPATVTRSTATAKSHHHHQVSLQLGPGPSEVRAQALSSWDVCFSAHGVAAAIGGSDKVSGVAGGPVDVAHLLLTSAKAKGAGSAPLVTPHGLTLRGAVLYATENVSSIFRQHRAVRMAVLSALPLAMDTSELLSGPQPTASANSSSSSGGGVAEAKKAAERALSLEAVCTLLLEVVAPPSLLPSLMKELGGGGGGATAAGVVGYVEGGPSSPTVRISSFIPAGEEETPASLDYGVVEAALSAVHRVLAEVSVALPPLIEAAYLPHSRTPSQTPSTPPTATAWRAADDALKKQIDRILRQLFTLVQVCARAVSVYPSWKARWLLARKITGIVSAFLSTALRVGQAGQATARRANSERSPTSVAWLVSSLSTLMAPWYFQTAKLLTGLWASKNGAAGQRKASLPQQQQQQQQQPQQNYFAQWIDDDEPEVRCAAARCAALLFDVMAQAATQLAACEAKHQGSLKPASSTASTNAHTDPYRSCQALFGFTETYAYDLVSALGPLLQPLVPLREATVAACESALLDRQPQVRCAAASALSSVSRTLSALCTVSAVARSASPSPSSTSSGKVATLPASVGEAVWKQYLSKATDALLSLMSDASSAVQLTLVAELADLLVTAPAPVSSTTDGPAKAVTRGSKGSTASTADEASLSPAQVRHAALLSCLDSLSKHEVWRFRERYAVLLCEMTTKFLTPRYPYTATTAGGSGTGGTGPSGAGGAVEDAAASESAAWGHTHPLFRLARQELLPMLVTVLFDKVKAVRDAALDATEVMCGRLNAAAAHSRTLGAGAGANNSGMGGGGGGLSLEDGAGSIAAEGAAAAWAGGSNRFVNDVLWPLIRDSPKAWETYLSRSALLRAAVRLRVDKESILLPLLDQLAHDSVLNVRLVVAKTIHEILVQSGAGGGVASPNGNGGGGAGGGSVFSPTTPGASSTQLLGSHRTLLSSAPPALRHGELQGGFNSGGGSDGNDGSGIGSGEADAMAMAPVVFTDAEKDDVVLKLLRQLLEDPSADVRDEAARALKVCF